MAPTSPRVLQVHHFRFPVTKGGVDRVVADVIEAYGLEHTTLLEVGRWDDRFLSRRQENGVTVYRKRLRTISKNDNWIRKVVANAERAWTVLQLYRILRRERIDVVHLHALHVYHWYFVVLSKLGLCRYVVTLHRAETIEFHNIPEMRRKRWTEVLDHASAIVAVSASLAKIAGETLPVSENPAVVLNGIDDPLKAPAAGEELPSCDSDYAICVGTLKHYKGHDIAVRAWGLLKESGLEVPLVIAGDGPLKSSLSSLIGRLNCGSVVKMVGAVSHGEALRLITNARLLVMPSRNEGLGLALVEAAALSRPVVASNLDVFREIVEHEKSALLFAPEDAEDLAKTVLRLVNDHQLCSDIGNNARLRYEEAFTRERMAENYRQLYSSTL